jgi:hypothetical protein
MIISKGRTHAIFDRQRSLNLSAPMSPSRGSSVLDAPTKLPYRELAAKDKARTPSIRLAAKRDVLRNTASNSPIGVENTEEDQPPVKPTTLGLPNPPVEVSKALVEHIPKELKEAVRTARKPDLRSKLRAPIPPVAGFGRGSISRNSSNSSFASAAETTASIGTRAPRTHLAAKRDNLRNVEVDQPHLKATAGPSMEVSKHAVSTGRPQYTAMSHANASIVSPLLAEVEQKVFGLRGIDDSKRSWHASQFPARIVALESALGMQPNGSLEMRVQTIAFECGVSARKGYGIISQAKKAPRRPSLS